MPDLGEEVTEEETVAFTVGVSGNAVVPSAETYTIPEDGAITLTAADSMYAYVDTYNPAGDHVTGYVWQFDATGKMLKYEVASFEGEYWNFTRVFGAASFVFGVEVGKHEMIKSVPVRFVEAPAETPADDDDDDGGGGENII